MCVFFKHLSNSLEGQREQTDKTTCYRFFLNSLLLNLQVSELNLKKSILLQAIKIVKLDKTETLLFSQLHSINTLEGRQRDADSDGAEVIVPP